MLGLVHIILKILKMENLYRCHYTSTQKLPSGKFGYLFRKLNNEILFISDEQFKRGDIVRVTDIDYHNNYIYLEVVKDRIIANKEKLPILMVVSTTIPFSEGLVPITESSVNHEIIYSTRTTYNGNQFYNLVLAINKIPETVHVNYVLESNNDVVVYTAEWTIRKERINTNVE